MSDPQRNKSSSTVLFKRMGDESIDADTRRACFELWKEALVWEAERRKRWFAAKKFYKEIHKVSPQDCNTAMCGRPVPPNGPVTWYKSSDALPVSKRGNLSSLVCARCLRMATRAGELAALYSSIEQYQQRGREGVHGLWKR
jgi:hypothetical protein